MDIPKKDYGIVILLDALGTRKRIQEDVAGFLTDWGSVLDRLEEDAKVLEQQLSRRGLRIGIKIKDIFDNVQIFYPVDDPHTLFVDLSGGNSLWWTIQHSGEMLTSVIRYAITRGIYLRGCISVGYILEYRNGLFSTALIENSDFAESLNMIGVVAAPSAMRVLNNKCYRSSPRFFRFVRYDISTNNPCSALRREVTANLAVLNLTRRSNMYINISDSEINDIIQGQIYEHLNNKKLRRKWENTRDFIRSVPNISDEYLFL
jgi:hypothetical protein